MIKQSIAISLLVCAPLSLLANNSKAVDKCTDLVSQTLPTCAKNPLPSNICAESAAQTAFNCLVKANGGSGSDQALPPSEQAYQQHRQQIQQQQAERQAIAQTAPKTKVAATPKTKTKQKNWFF